MRPADLGRLVRTVRHLRSEQVAGLLRRLMRRGASGRPVRARGGPASLGGPPAVAWLPPPEHLVGTTPDRLSMLGRVVPWSLPIGWEREDLGPLGRFHLQYCDWVRSETISPELRLRVLSDWVDRCEGGVGWGPAPISWRVFVWLKLLTTPGALPDDAAARLVPSLADQLATLAANVETHLLANHYLSNLLALVAGGVALRGSESARWLRHAPALIAELDEEFPADGAHYERSPMYHSELLERVLDLLNLVRGQPERAPEGLEAALVACAARARRALRIWTHPDGRIALFSDSALGMTAEPSDLHRYAETLGVSEGADEPVGVLGSAGFVRLAAGPYTLIGSVGGPAPPYQPGHAHCDGLSFELSVGPVRVVTDTGVFEYARGARRDRSRATTSHATLEIEGAEQAEFWAAHRIGGRPQVDLEVATPGVRAVASCRGWATPDLVHRRRFEVEAGTLRVSDALSRPAAVVATLPLAPGLEPELAGSRARVPLGDTGVLEIELPAGLRWRQERSPYFPSYGREEMRWSLVGESSHSNGGVFDFRVSRVGIEHAE